MKLQAKKKKTRIRLPGCESAAAAKARCMYGDRFTTDDYSRLSQCATVGEAASFLNSKKRYASVLSSEKAISGMHREQIEYMLEKRKYGDYKKLSLYLKGRGEYVKRFLCAKREASLLIRAVSGLGLDLKDESFNILMSDFDKESKIRISELSDAVTYDDILKASEFSEYYDILLKYAPQNGEYTDIAHLEADIWNLIFDSLSEMVGALSSKKEQAQARDFFKTYIDAKNVSTILRLKKYPDTNEEYISSVLLKHGTIGMKKLQPLIIGSNDDGKDKKITKILDAGADAELRLCAEKCRKYMRYSTYPAITVLCYMYLLELELGNIVKIVEGIRYSLSPDVILSLIITED